MAPKAARLVALLVAGTIALLAGCGDDEGPTKDDFVAEAGSICERNKAQADRVAQREFASFGKGAPSPAESQQFLAAVLPIIRDSSEEIAALEAPEGDEDVIEAYLESYDRASDEMETIASDPERAAALMRGSLEDPFTAADRMAGEYGIEKCSGDDA